MESKCWEWPGSRFASGYGSLRIKGKTKRLHRVMYEIANGPIPEGLEVMHRCDNPPCFNPAHLKLGTHAENMADAAKKSRTAKWPRHFRSKLSPEQIQEIRQRWIAGETQASIAQSFDLHSSYVSRLISGERRP